MGQRKKTSTKYDTLGCVFDEVLFFHFKNIGRNELRRASIKVSFVVTDGYEFHTLILCVCVSDLSSQCTTKKLS
jgi:hypothetical protein